MTFYSVQEDKKRYLDLLLVADPDEDMIDTYLSRGELVVLEEDDEIKAVAVVLDKGDGVCELMNLAVRPGFQGRGLGGAILRYLFGAYASRFHTMELGTSDATDRAVRLYESHGFVLTHRDEGYFVREYPEPIFEDNGVQCIDRLCYEKIL